MPLPKLTRPRRTRPRTPQPLTPRPRTPQPLTSRLRVPRLRVPKPRALRLKRPPRRPGEARPWRFRLTQRRRRHLVQAVMLGCVLALVPSTWTHAVADSRIRTVAEVPARDVAMVFGAGLRSGRPTPYLAHRLDAAAELYHAGKVKVVLVTGDNSREEYDEPDAMRTYLVGRGVPDDRIVSDYAGFDTWDSCVRAKKIFGVDRAVLVTQGFHVRRAVALCGAAGVESYGVGVAERRDATWYYGGIREVFASAKAAAEAALRPDPLFLGPAETGVTEALAAGGGAR
ncbi:vancomycin high temperature exclusion protein [Streptomyces sp. NPDC056652]|uniref:SanA/YdcF family protein n=1 Tax=Streptomyces sp. NPDC056652 TaxID=3345893 RepID=UPI00368103A1